MIQQALESRTGGRVEAEAVSVTGFRGFRVRDFSASTTSPTGTSVQVRVPELLIFLNFVDLFYGDIAIEPMLAVERVQADNAVVQIRLGEDGPRTDTTKEPRDIDAILAKLPARTAGRNCRLEIEELAQGQGLIVSGLGFSVSRGRETGRLNAQVAGHLMEDADRRFEAALEYVSREDFRAELDVTALASSDLNRYLPPERRYVESGLVHPSVRLACSRGKAYDLFFEAPFENLVVRGQHEFLEPVSGSFSARASFSEPEGLVSLRSATIESDVVRAGLSGSVDLEGDTPRFDLELQAARLPIDKIVEHFSSEYVDEHGRLEFLLAEPYKITVEATGTPGDYRLTASSGPNTADLSFHPKQDRYPTVNLQLGRIDASWDSASKEPKVSLQILGGRVAHAETGLTASDVSGSAQLNGTEVRIPFLNVNVGGDPIRAALTYDFETRSGSASASGTLSGLEDTVLHDSIRKTVLAGSAWASIKATIEENSFTVDADVDATQTAAEYDWWLDKPAGIGVKGKVHLEVTPKKRLELTADAVLVDSTISVNVLSTHDGERWKLQSTEAHSERLDVVTAGKCLRIPYVITGGTATEGWHKWTRTSQDDQHWTIAMGCAIDNAAFLPYDPSLPEQSEHPFKVKDAVVSSEMIKGESKKGAVTVSVGEGETPPFDKPWFLPLLDAELAEKYPPTGRVWTYNITADKLAVPPWSGVDFSGTGYGDLEKAGLSRYEAVIDGGHMLGSYDYDRTDNVYKATNEWRDVPASYFIKHLDFPDVLGGKTTGNATWTQDIDDPRTLDGSGAFEVRNGQFNADYMIAQLEQIGGQDATLPPILRFESLGSKITFRQDRVETSDLRLKSDHIELSGKGWFVTEGDMDYDVRIRISPELAGEIPTLRESVTVEGYRIAQQDIELVFNITGPTLKPRSELTQAPPVSVTLVAGGLEMTSTALKVIDTPRKILIDLLKIGSGIVGP